MAISPREKMHRRVGAVVSRMTLDQCNETIAKIAAEGITIFHPTIREITGGFNSQSINHNVMLKLRDRRNALRKLEVAR